MSTPNCFNDPNNNPISPNNTDPNIPFESGQNNDVINSENGDETPLDGGGSDENNSFNKPFTTPSTLFPPINRTNITTEYNSGQLIYLPNINYPLNVLNGSFSYSGTSLTGDTASGYLDGIFYYEIEVYLNTILRFFDRKTFFINGTQSYTSAINYFLSFRPTRVIQKIGFNTNFEPDSLKFTSTNFNIIGFGIDI